MKNLGRVPLTPTVKVAMAVPLAAAILSLAACDDGNAASCPPPGIVDEPHGPGLPQVNHFVIVVMENHTFDNLYGLFPGADGIVDENGAITAPPQVDAQGVAYNRLPNPPAGTGFVDLPNRPFALSPSLLPSDATPDLAHRFYLEQAQINGGAMNKFAAYSDAGGLTMAYYDTMTLPVPKLALGFTVCDRFFHSAYGGSFLNHMWLISAAPPVFPDAPADFLETGDVFPQGPHPFPLSDDGTFTGMDALLTPDGYAINTINSINLPHPVGSDPASLLPVQNRPTIGDTLSAAGLTWAWYAAGWNAALAYTTADGKVADGAPTPDDFKFAYHHQPFVYFSTTGNGTAAKAQHLKDESDFMAAVRAGTLPAVSFVKPSGIDNEHPGVTDVMRGEDHLAALIRAVMAGPNWPDTAIIITYDEYGGFADHVAPPAIDRWGPGARVPTIVISRFARKGFVDHTTYETVSILATLEHRWGLPPLTVRDANAHDLSGAFLGAD